MLGVRALELESDARTVRSSQQSGPLTPDEVRDAQNSLRRARLLSVDKAPLMNEGVMLFVSGRRKEGLEVARRVVAEEPDNLDAWIALYYMYSTSNDPKRAAATARRVRALNPLAGDRLRDTP
jgi:hypothetical protein